MNLNKNKSTNFWYELQDMKAKYDRLLFEHKTIKEKYVSYKDENKKLRKENRELKDQLNNLQMPQETPQGLSVRAELSNKPFCQQINETPKTPYEGPSTESEIWNKFDDVREKIGVSSDELDELPEAGFTSLIKCGSENYVDWLYYSEAEAEWSKIK